MNVAGKGNITFVPIDRPPGTPYPAFSKTVVCLLLRSSGSM